jgi:hypothetical protein
MATTRPKQAIGPDHPQSTRDPSGSPEGASAPSGVPGGENTRTQPQTATPAAETAPAQKASPRAAKPVTSEPAVIVFGRNVYGIPQAGWFPANEADLATRAARLMGLRVLRVEDDTHRALAAQLRPGQVYASDRTFAPAVAKDVFDALSALAGPVGAASVPDDVSESTASATRPVSWEAITFSSVVLASAGPGEGWWEATVIGAKDDQLILRWRDAAREASFTRAPSELALLPPAAA